MIQFIAPPFEILPSVQVPPMADQPGNPESPSARSLPAGEGSSALNGNGVRFAAASNGPAVEKGPAHAAANGNANGTAKPEANAPPTAEELATLERASRELETATPEGIIRWAVEHYFPKLTMATAFGPEGCVILYYLAKIEPRVHVFNLDTGYQFKETLELRDRIAEKYGIHVEMRRPATTVEEYEKLHGGPLYVKDSKQCCFDRKVSVLRQAAVGWRAWMSGIRRDQTDDRAVTPIVGWDAKFNLVKISPLANWTKKDVWKLVMKEGIPYNPLHDQGYPSIGCFPCTRPVGLGEDDRAGRWNGQRKECGLHTQEEKPAPEPPTESKG